MADSESTGRQLGLGVAIVTLFVVAFLNCVTVLFADLGCNPQDAGSPPNVYSGTPAARVCQLFDPGWKRAHYYGSKSSWEKVFHGKLPQGAYFVPGGFQAAVIQLRAIAILFAPVILVLAGVVLARRRRDLRYFALGSLSGSTILASLWVIFLFMRK